jgi:hypothetical protein
MSYLKAVKCYAMAHFTMKSSRDHRWAIIMQDGRPISAYKRKARSGWLCEELGGRYSAHDSHARKRNGAVPPSSIAGLVAPPPLAAEAVKPVAGPEKTEEVVESPTDITNSGGDIVILSEGCFPDEPIFS